MSNVRSKNSLQQFLTKNQTGSSTFPFDFIDMDGKIRTLNDYKDKIIVLDFWFTGCIPCTEIPPLMKRIMGKFVDQNDVIFLSVSVDSSKEIWLKGLKSEKYTVPGQIHLKTNGDGRYDPFILNYNITGYPRLFLIGKQGKLLSSNPKDPRSDGGNEIIKLIQDII